MTPEMLDSIHPHLHAANVDLKAFRDDFYKTQCGAKLAPVLDTLKTMKKLGIWVEVTTLIIPTLNDSKEELSELARFIADDLGPETPWHISRFHPTYRAYPLTDQHRSKHCNRPGKSVRKRVCAMSTPAMFPGMQEKKPPVIIADNCSLIVLDFPF